jgi:molybdate transport system permease protein
MTGWLPPEAATAVWLSLRVSFWATVLSLPLAVLVALLLARGRFPGRGILNGLVRPW